MEASRAAESLLGNKLYQQRARRVLPILVRQAFAHQPIYYSDLAAELDDMWPLNLNHPLGSIGQALKLLSKEWDEEIPPLSCLVISKTTDLPGEGVGWFIADVNEFAKLPLKQRQAIVEIELQKIFAYPRWLDVLHALGLERKPVRDYSQLTTEAQKRLGKGESEHHKRFKQYVSQNPQILKLPKRVAPGETEYQLPSDDVVDVLFKGKKNWTAAEVKSRISSTADVYRGLYQCVKYRAVIEAYQSELGNLPGCYAVLVVEGKFPKELIELKNVLGVEVVDEVSM